MYNHLEEVPITIVPISVKTTPAIPNPVNVEKNDWNVIMFPVVKETKPHTLPKDN